MKECWVTEPLHFEMRETEIPEPKDNEVQIKMMAAGVCGSDIHIYKGENPNSRYPLIPGHENVGLVTKVGADCKNIKVGDHVVIDYVIRCGECYQCKHGRGNVCEHVLVRGSGTNGGWREYWCVEEPYVYKIDDSIPWKDAALIEPLTIGEHSTSRAGVCEDDVVFILGTGTIGTIIAQALGVPESVIALTFVALGTSLPELVTAITSLMKGHSDLSLGNIVGANVFNLVLVSGVSVALAPFDIPQSATLFGINSSLVLELPVMLLVMILLTIPALVRGRLSRVQGVALLCIYAAFCAVQFTL